MEAADSGKGLLPPGGTRYPEVAAVTDARQGAAITSTIAVLSGFTPLAARKYRLCGEVGGDCTSG